MYHSCNSVFILWWLLWINLLFIYLSIYLGFMDVKFGSRIKNIHFGFTQIHWCEIAMYTQYFLEFCEKKRTLESTEYTVYISVYIQVKPKWISWFHCQKNINSNEIPFCLQSWTHVSSLHVIIMAPVSTNWHPIPASVYEDGKESTAPKVQLSSQGTNTW